MDSEEKTNKYWLMYKTVTISSNFVLGCASVALPQIVEIVPQVIGQSAWMKPQGLKAEGWMQLFLSAGLTMALEQMLERPELLKVQHRLQMRAETAGSLPEEAASQVSQICHRFLGQRVWKLSCVLVGRMD